MEDRVLGLPGIFFSPSDEILVNHYLRERIVNGFSSAPDYLIKEFDVYSTEPWYLPCDSFKYQDADKSRLFFTPRHPASSDKQKNARRTAGGGVWHNNAKLQSIKIGSSVIGHKRSFNFKIKKGTEEIKTEWIMHEYCLSSASSTTPFGDLVLCRVHENGKKREIDDGHKRSREEGAVEQSLAKRRHGEKDDSSSSLASWHMLPTLQSVEEGCEASLAPDDGLFSVEAAVTAGAGLVSVEAPSAVDDRVVLTEGASSTPEDGLFSENLYPDNTVFSLDELIRAWSSDNDEL